MPILNTISVELRQAAIFLATVDGKKKDTALRNISAALLENQAYILEENQRDISAAKSSGMIDSMIDRLTLTPQRLVAISESVLKVAQLPDPIGIVLDDFTHENGLHFQKVRVPIGVVGIIFEARPNVTVDSGVLCLKSGNAVLLRGGKETIFSNIALEKVMQDALEQSEFPRACITLLHDTTRQTALNMMTRNGLLDLLIPRGGAGLIRTVVENASVPVIQTGTGNCHIYVDKSAKVDMAVRIVTNAKAQRVSVCNAAETLLVHKDIAKEFLPKAYVSLKNAGVELRGCSATRAVLGDIDAASVEDFATEFLDYILAVRVVSDFDQAIEHIRKFSTGHSECIVTESPRSAEQFLNQLDSAVLYVNASTRFTDGEEFGMGAEIGISTQKMHARGPMGMEALCSYKYLVRGTGQIR